MRRRPLVTVAATAALLGAGGFAALHAEAATLTSNWYASAPYLMPFDNSPPDPVEVMNVGSRRGPRRGARARCTPGGDQFSYNGHTWQAKRWTQGETPGNHDVWQDNRAC